MDSIILLGSVKGLKLGQVIAIGAEAGTGKSTLCSMLTNDSLYISTEETYNQVNKRFLRVNPDSMSDILSEKELANIMDAITNTKKNIVIIDSLNSINNGTDSYVKQAQNAHLLTGLAKKLNKVLIIICQVTRSGEITGMSSLLHIVDTIIYFEKSPVSDNLILTSTKNRFGEVGEVAMFRHTHNGLIETSENYDNCGIGETATNIRFGTKNIPIKIEALVSRGSINYGYRQSYGINKQRVQQILAIIQTNSSIDFSDKDVYVSVSNGLTVKDTKSDFAIANSILSSIFQKTIELKDRTGEISLNGTIKYNSEFKHIKELISRYR